MEKDNGNERIEEDTEILNLEKLKKLSEGRKKKKQMEQVIELQDEEREAQIAKQPRSRVIRFKSWDEAEEKKKKEEKNEEKKCIYRIQKNYDVEKYADLLEKKRNRELEKEEDKEKKDNIKKRFNKRFKRFIKKNKQNIIRVHGKNFKKELSAPRKKINNMIALYEQRFAKPIRTQIKKQKDEDNLQKYLLELYHENKEQIKEVSSEEEVEESEPNDEEKEIIEKITKAGIPLINNKFIAPNYKAEYAEEEEEEELISIRHFPSYEAASLGVNMILKKTMKAIAKKEEKRIERIEKNKKSLSYNSFNFNL